MENRTVTFYRQEYGNQRKEESANERTRAKIDLFVIASERRTRPHAVPLALLHTFGVYLLVLIYTPLSLSLIGRTISTPRSLQKKKIPMSRCAISDAIDGLLYILLALDTKCAFGLGSIVVSPPRHGHGLSAGLRKRERTRPPLRRSSRRRRRISRGPGASW